MKNTKGLIVVTGASRGIGRAIALRYARAGHPVLAIARNFDNPLDGNGIRSLTADLRDPADIGRVAEAVNAWGLPCEVMINNAGIQNEVDLRHSETDEPLISDEVALNLVAPVLLVRALLPLMRQPGATIVNVTSLVSRHPKTSAPIYSATKAGLASFTKSLRKQVAQLGVFVMEAVPPLVDTAMTAGRGTGKITAEAMADAIYAGVSKRRRIVAPGFSQWVLMLDRILPELVGHILSKS